MEQNTITINLSFTTEMGKKEYEKVLEILNVFNTEPIDNKKFIDLFSLDKRPLLVMEQSSEIVSKVPLIKKIEINITG